MRFGSLPGMGNNLRQLRLDRGWTHDEAAAALGVSRGQFIKLERGERRLTSDYIKRAARAFDVPQQLVIADDEEPDTVQVVGYVGAGSRAYFLDESHSPFDRAPRPTGAGPNTVAVEIRGTSLGKALDGWYAYYEDRQEPVTESILGRLCAVGLADGRVLIKMVRRAKTPGLFHLYSETEDPILDAELRWAAPITDMKPKPWLG